MGQPNSRLQTLLDGVKADWQGGKLKYDPRHLMANWALMVAANKRQVLASVFLSYTSDALFAMLPGEYERVLNHLREMHTPAEKIGKLRRRYWRRHAKYGCSDPATIIRRLYDVYTFFEGLDDPMQPGHRFFVDDSWKIFLREIGYVQKGLLSDPPGMDMYIPIRTARTGFVFHRSIRTSSPLEGYHLHLRGALAAGARAAGPEYQIARSNLFDFVWNIKAAVKAGVMLDQGHYEPWLVDLLWRICEGWLSTEELPRALQGWRPTQTDVEPLTFRSIDYDQLKLIKTAGAAAVKLSPLRSEADIERVLRHPQMVLRGDAAGIARATGIVTSHAKLKERSIRVLAL